MISKAAILEHAAEWQLTAGVVEKDYVLGWLLAGIALTPPLAEAWIFKGGTCLKKCVIETYRFSEDLDFTLLPSAPYDENAIREALLAVTVRVTELSGIQFPAGEVRVRPRRDQSGAPTFEGSVGYAGPLAVPGPPKIRFDLTQNEPVLRPTELRAITHPYPDKLPGAAQIRCYSLPELVAEKTRALYERTRPRDLYDVVLLSDHAPTGHEAIALRALAKEKFASKKLALPSAEAVFRLAQESAELGSEWDNMLGHQLPATPPLNDFLARLREAIAWLDEPQPQAARPPRTPLHAAPYGRGEESVASQGIRIWGVRAPLETARFAGASHLLIEFSYHGARRKVEPYSLRRPKTGNLLLYGYEQRKNGTPTDAIRAYKVDEIEDLRVTNEAFTPRYAIELVERPGAWKW